MRKLIATLLLAFACCRATAQIFEAGAIQKMTPDPRAAKETPAPSAEGGHEASVYHGHLMVDGVAVDPLGKGSYLWPQVSPDGKSLVFWCVGQGCFVSDIDGANPRHLGGMRAAVWAGNDAIIGMYDLDNGRAIVESMLVGCDVATGEKQLLTSRDEIKALYPRMTPGGVTFMDPDGNRYFIPLKKIEK